MRYFILAVLIIGISFSYFFFGSAKRADKIVWGVNFSQKQAENLGLDWKETLSFLLSDLGARNFKIAVYWDLIEQKEGEYRFEDLDWQIRELGKYGAKAILVVGRKSPRWPECHEPSWVRNQISNLKSQILLEYLKEVVNRYKDSGAVWAWQVENEPFLKFGQCPWPPNEELLKEEVSLVKSLDNRRPVIVSASGEWSSWFKEARIGDMVGITMYRTAWFEDYQRQIKYPFPPVFYWLKAQLIKTFFQKDVLVIELQAEPWRESIGLREIQKNIAFAKKTGFDRFYFWGAEWWYWLKTKKGDPGIWEEARNTFRENI
ncbi:MAG: hypothetical protein HYW70_01980 [Candidatus Nealsonbacteria bacterium]|nr:hypothetical protein [Candidatus Nealsonbacteria bacterium]